MPNRLFQGIVNQMREAIDRTIGVVDETGTVIACSELGLIGEVRKGVVSSGVFGTTQTCVDNATYTTFDVLVRPEYAVFVDGTDELLTTIPHLLQLLLTKSSKTMMKNLIGQTL